MFDDKYISDWDEENEEFEFEDEDERENEEEEIPFNAELIRVDTTPITIDHMQRLIEREKLNLFPEFQRRKVWKEIKRKSLLIESLMLRIPLPVFYVYEDEDGIWHVVDGLQRLSTIYDFIQDKFALKGLQYLKYLDGKKFSDLESEYPKYHNRIMNNVKLTINVIDATTPAQVKYDIFRRINTGGVPLNAQEIRNSTAKAQVRKLLNSMVISEEFQEATNGMKDLRMQAQELALRFIAFHSIYNFEDNIVSYKKGIDALLDETFDELNHMKQKQLIKYRRIFKNALKNSSLLFGSYAFRRVSSYNWRKNPINKSLFTCLTVILSYYDHDHLVGMDIGDRVLDALAEKFDEDIEFSESFSKGTTDPYRVNIQFKRTRELIDEELRNAKKINDKEL